MRLPPLRTDPSALPPLREHGASDYARDALQMVPAPKGVRADVVMWIVVGSYLALALALIAISYFGVGHG
jgi:hypothetical protein